MLLDEFAYNGFGSNGGGGIALQGIQGVQGLQGVQGVQGLDGKFLGQGLQGLQGELGLQGVQGVQAVQGVESSQGIQGQIGLQGFQGVQGVQALEGFQGFQALQGIQGVQGVQSLQGIQGNPLTATPSVWGYFFRTADFIFPTANTFNQQIPCQGVTGSNFDARYTPNIPNPLVGGATFALTGRATNKVSFRWRVYAIFENIGGTDEQVQYFNAWYVSFLDNSRITINAGTQKQIFFDYISANTNIDFVYALSYGFLVTSTNLVLRDLRIVDYRVADSPIAGVIGVQGVQGLQGFQSTTPTRYVEYGVLSSTFTAPPNPSFTLDAIISQSGGFSLTNFGGITNARIQGVSVNTPLLIEGYILIENTSGSAKTFVLSIASDAIVGSSIQQFTIAIGSDGLAYPLFFSCIADPSLNNEKIRCTLQTQPYDATATYRIVGNGDYGFRVVISELRGVQGLQSTIQGTQGLQGIIGVGSQGLQGLQGIEASQGVQGVQGVQGLIASQGIQGLQGVQGLQGIQGFESFANDAPAYCIATNSVNQSIPATTNTRIEFDAQSATASYFSANLASDRITINEGGFFKVSILLNIEGNATNSSDVYVYAYSVDAGFTGIPSTTTLKKVGVGQYETLVFEAIFNSPRRNYYEFYIYSTQAITLYAQSAVSPYPSGFSSRVSMSLVSRDYEHTENAILTWDSGFFNLTNGIDNPIPFSTYNESASAIGIAPFDLIGTNASFNITATGVYMIDTFASFYDLGSGITMSTTLYTSTSPGGVGWTFLTITGRERYEGTNTNQIQQGKYLLRVTSQIYVQMRVNPSGNSPFPFNVSSAYTNMVITRIGDI
jgi:hypothetical protein